MQARFGLKPRFLISPIRLSNANVSEEMDITLKKVSVALAVITLASGSLAFVGSMASADTRSHAALFDSSSPTTSTPSTSDTTSTSTSTTTTTLPLELPQRGWSVLARSPRGVMVDRRTIIYAGIPYTVVRFRARTTAFHLHGGTIDPPGTSSGVPADAKPVISDGELRVGVLAAFNGGFKADAKSGGVILDGKVIEAMQPGMATACINNLGQLKIAAWGAGLPRKNFAAISCRQNLPLMVAGGQLTALAENPAWGNWGATLAAIGAQPRSGLGLDAKGNVIYIATMTGTLPAQLAHAEVAAGIVTGMQLDINPDWPTIGVFGSAQHHRSTKFILTLPGYHKPPAYYMSSSARDFFSVMAQPNSWTCSVSTPGLRNNTMTAQPLSISPGC